MTTVLLLVITGALFTVLYQLNRLVESMPSSDRAWPTAEDLAECQRPATWGRVPEGSSLSVRAGVDGDALYLGRNDHPALGRLPVDPSGVNDHGPWGYLA